MVALCSFCARERVGVTAALLRRDQTAPRSAPSPACGRGLGEGRSLFRPDKTGATLCSLSRMRERVGVRAAPYSFSTRLRLREYTTLSPE